MNKYKEMKYERVIRELHEEIDRISEEKDNLEIKLNNLMSRFEETAIELDELKISLIK